MQFCDWGLWKVRRISVTVLFHFSPKWTKQLHFTEDKHVESFSSFALSIIVKDAIGDVTCRDLQICVSMTSLREKAPVSLPPRWSRDGAVVGLSCPVLQLEVSNAGSFASADLDTACASLGATSECKKLNTCRRPLPVRTPCPAVAPCRAALQKVLQQRYPVQDAGFASQLLSPLQTYAGGLYLNFVQGCRLHYRKGKKLLRVFCYLFNHVMCTALCTENCIWYPSLAVF